MERIFTNKWENTWLAWRKMFLDMLTDCKNGDSMLYFLMVKVMINRIWRRVECIVKGHGKTHDWVSLKDPGWVAVYCTECGVMLYMEKRK